MKFCNYFDQNNHPRVGIIWQSELYDLAINSGNKYPSDMLTLLSEYGSKLDLILESIVLSEALDKTEQVKFAPLICNPSKILAIGLNYQEHINEVGATKKTIPVMFMKMPSALSAHKQKITWKSSLTKKVDYEAELAIVIGKKCYQVSENDAYDYIAGYTIANDLSARDLQTEYGDQWIRAKSIDGFCPLGPTLIGKKQISDPHNLSIRCYLNSELMQDSHTSLMIYKIPFLIEYLSRAFTLYPGDVILTGTPPGVGMSKTPQRYLKSGDQTKVEIQDLGSLENTFEELN